jgi:hypothetical protein
MGFVTFKEKDWGVIQDFSRACEKRSNDHAITGLLAGSVDGHESPDRIPHSLADVVESAGFWPGNRLRREVIGSPIRPNKPEQCNKLLLMHFLTTTSNRDCLSQN